MRLMVRFAPLGALIVLVASPALAQMPPGGHGPHDALGAPHVERPPMPDFRVPHWNEGRWHRGPHEGRDGWWWIVGGVWYYYPAPVYPYPDLYTPPTVVVETAPNIAGSYAYYCASPSGYYPYVRVCNVRWERIERVVEAVPVQAPAPVMDDAAGTSQRTLDDRQLNGYGAEFEAIKASGRGVQGKLKNLAERVALFHQALFSRDYNAMDILKDTEALEGRIAAGRGQR